MDSAARIKAVLFDKDGTIVDSLGAWAEAERLVCRALARRALAEPSTAAAAIAAEEAALAAIGVKGDEVDKGGLLAMADVRTILESLRRSLSDSLGAPRLEWLGDERRFRVAFDEAFGSLYPSGSLRCRAMEGADEALSALAELGMPLGIATADDRSTTLSQLEELGWGRRFAFIACGDTSPRPKPDPWSALEFAKAVGIEPGQIAVVGDTEADLGMARAAGAMLFVRVVDSLAGLAPFLAGVSRGEAFEPVAGAVFSALRLDSY